MHKYPLVKEQASEFRIGLTEMRDPNRGVYKDHFSERLLGMSCVFGALPPRSASRRPDSRAISDLRATLTSSVFSMMPVNSRASAIKPSSMFNVVLIWHHHSILMHTNQCTAIVTPAWLDTPPTVTSTPCEPLAGKPATGIRALICISP